jgi:hypothetical protein
MTPANAVLLAYAVVAVLLWGYAALLFMQSRRPRRSDTPQDVTT